MELTERLLPLGLARPGTPLPLYNSITIHWIGPYPSQNVEDPRKWWIDSKQEASAHFILKDDIVICTVPISEVAWHCGCRAGNFSSIGIEVIPASKNGEFSSKSVQTLKELIATLNKVELKRHYDWTGKDCPLYYTPLSTIEGGDKRWEELKNEIADLS
jgi:N-acetylmuramoyl-L-alanine amidase CwlA